MLTRHAFFPLYMMELSIPLVLMIQRDLFARLWLTNQAIMFKAIGVTVVQIVQCQERNVEFPIALNIGFSSTSR